jgi:glycerol-3-phosphate dehydrogenase
MRDSRSDTLERLSRDVFDLLVVGGGIIGARTAFEAARCGLRVALVDAGDFGGATSSASSKLIHGGFRYLPMGDVGLIRQSQRERQLLLHQIAPNLVRRLPFLLPVYERASRGLATIAAGLVLYRGLAGHGGHIEMLSARSAQSLVPPIRTSGLRMTGVFEEAETIDARLVLSTVKAAAACGALVLNHARVVGLELRHNRGGAIAIECPQGSIEVRTRHVINAAGASVDHIRRLDQPASTPLVRLSKGVHLLLPIDAPWEAGVAMPLSGGRVALGIPWQGMLMLGTTDSLYEGDPADVTVTPADARTVLDEAAGYLPADMLRPGLVRFHLAGLRALPIAEGDTAAARRGHLIDTSPNGLVSVAGGKLTTHRVIAVDALRRLPERGLINLQPDCGQLPATGWDARLYGRSGLDPDVSDHLQRLYGDEAGEVLALGASMPGGHERIHPSGPDIWAQAAYAVMREWARTVGDITQRRTTLAVRGLATESIVQRLAGLLTEPALSGERAAGCNPTRARVSHHSIGSALEGLAASR